MTGISLVDEVDGHLTRVTADLAYDTLAVYGAAGARGALLHGATRQGWSKGSDDADDVMKLCSPSNGCEIRPVKGDPPTPVASLAASAVTKTPMRRHASEWAVGFTATK